MGCLGQSGLSIVSLFVFCLLFLGSISSCNEGNRMTNPARHHFGAFDIVCRYVDTFDQTDVLLTLCYVLRCPFHSAAATV